MHLELCEHQGLNYLAGLPGERLLRDPEDILEVVGACWGRGVDRVLLFAANLTDGFFRLGSGEAGVVLQKLRNYGIRTAAVLPVELTERGRFGQMVEEENRGVYFRVFPTRAEAEAWLVGK